jgi:hypothetical protein
VNETVGLLVILACGIIGYGMVTAVINRPRRQHEPQGTNSENKTASMQAFKTLLKALAIMALAALGSCSLTAAAGDHSFGGGDQGLEVGVGIFLLLGAFFLYRTWFVRGG